MAKKNLNDRTTPQLIRWYGKTIRGSYKQKRDEFGKQTYPATFRAQESWYASRLERLREILKSRGVDV